MEWWGYLVTALGAVVLLSNGYSALKNLASPAISASKRMKTIEETNTKHEKRFDNIEEKLSEQEDVNKALLKGLYAVINHMVDGNGTDKLRESRDELTKFIIER